MSNIDALVDLGAPHTALYEVPGQGMIWRSADGKYRWSCSRCGAVSFLRCYSTVEARDRLLTHAGAYCPGQIPQESTS